MLKTGKRIQTPRRYSEDFKRKLVADYEQGLMSVAQMERHYGVRGAVIYRWIYKYSTYQTKQVRIVELKESQTDRIAQLEAQIKQLQQALGSKQMQLDYLEQLLELARQEYGVDLKKNSSIPPYGGSKSIRNK